MLTTLGVVEVRPSPELCRLTAGRRLGGKSLIEWVVRRVTDGARARSNCGAGADNSGVRRAGRFGAPRRALGAQ